MTPTPAPPAWAHRTTDATAEQLAAVDAWWRAANYLSIGQIYLQGNPLLRHRLSRDDIKPRLLGHWGTTPGLNFLYAHLNRAIRDRDLNTLYVTGPGHGGPGMVANAYLDGTYTERYPGIDHGLLDCARLLSRFPEKGVKNTPFPTYNGTLTLRVAASVPGAPACIPYI